MKALNRNAHLKKKILRANYSSYKFKTLRKAIIRRSYCEKKYQYFISNKKKYFWRNKSCGVFYLKQLPLNDKQKFESPYQLIDGERLLAVVIGVASFRSANL